VTGESRMEIPAIIFSRSRESNMPQSKACACVPAPNLNKVVICALEIPVLNGTFELRRLS
jgi:hypothetical protein